MKPLPVQEVSGDKDAPSLPARVVLMGSQQRMLGSRHEIYVNYILKLETPQGLQAGNISFPWRQDSDEITVHKVLIHRGDQTIDVLKAGQTFTVLRREQNLEQSTLDGVLTANMFPEGLQVRDALEVATTVVSNDPVLAGHGEASFGPLNTAIDRAHLRLLWKPADKVRLSETPDLPPWKRGREGEFETAELTLESAKSVTVPDDAPVRFRIVRYAQASDFASTRQAMISAILR